MLRHYVRGCVVVSLASLLFLLSGCGAVSNMFGGSSSGSASGNPTQMVQEIMNLSSKNAIDIAKQVGGYALRPDIKIGLPSEIEPLQELLSSNSSQIAPFLQGMGASQLFDPLVSSMNQAAQEAAGDALQIFWNSIKSLSITDGLTVLQGGNTGATQLLESKARPQLYAQYKPKVEQAMQRLNVNGYWNRIAGVYNGMMNAGLYPVLNGLYPNLGLQQSYNPDLADYITNKALDGLFKLMGQEEIKIRQDPKAYGMNLLNKFMPA